MSTGNGQILERLVFVPDRQPLIELIFGLALRGKRSGAIAKQSPKPAGKPNRRRGGCVPRLFTVDKINAILKNPRYAGLSIWNGEIVARGH
jgi:hypothetical protein